MAKQYVVTAFVKRLKRRDTLSKPMSFEKATKFKKERESEMKTPGIRPEYKWARDFKIKPVS